MRGQTSAGEETTSPQSNPLLLSCPQNLHFSGLLALLHQFMKTQFHYMAAPSFSTIIFITWWPGTLYAALFLGIISPSPGNRKDLVSLLFWNFRRPKDGGNCDSDQFGWNHLDQHYKQVNG